MSALGGTIDIPKIGPVKKVYAYGAGGLLVAYVGWRYYTAGRSGTVPAAGEDTELGTSSVTDTPGGTAGGGGTSGYVDTSGTDGMVLSNDQWTAKASDLLQRGGWDAQVILTALGKYLGHQALTDSEILLVRAALAVAGPPPVGSFVIVHQTGDGVSPSAPLAPAPSPAPVVPAGPKIPTPTKTVLPLVAKAPTAIKSAPAKAGQASVTPKTLPAGPVYADVRANERMGDWQGRVIASFGFAPTLVELRKLNPTKGAVLEKMDYNTPHPAVQLRIK